jgi:hypothetical protein
LIVTLEVGPRILSYGFVGGPNLLKVSQKDAGNRGGEDYRSYGGHRLWIAPEEVPKTYQPDNDPVEVTEEDGVFGFASAPDAYHLQKEIRIQPSQEIGGFRIEHRIYNRGLYGVELAPWALTVMDPGGVCLVPQHDHIPHGEVLLPARPLVLWPYTDMSDPRYTWGKQVLRLRQDADLGPTKFGMLVDQGYAAYANHGQLFIKRFEAEGFADYPDFNSNFESFTRQDMLEVETLGPIQIVEPDDYAVHYEAWYLVPNVTVPEGDAECRAWLDGLVSERPL